MSEVTNKAIARAILNPKNWFMLGCGILLIAVVSCMPEMQPAAASQLEDTVQK